ncbi:MAG TPA: hypothetical protein VJP76_02990 [Candidatus Tumulicola sp.]|nr:hypothetical protein [Candidatus Tumulicola sp.]
MNSKKEIVVKQYYTAIAFIVCALPYTWGWPRSWLAALPITAAVFAAMLWLMRRMPLRKDEMNASTQWLVITFAVLMIGHGLIIRMLIGLPIFAGH